MTTRSHPISEVLGSAALGQLPTAAEVDALPLPPESKARLTREIRNAAAEAVALRLAGANSRARAVAHEAADRLADETRDLRGAAELPANPGALADLIPRR